MKKCLREYSKGLIFINDLIVIAGPTASGKTSLSIELAKKIDGEIVNADSMQIYKYMDIGTAKPTVSERCGIAHHLIDIVMPSESFSVARYCELANEVISDIKKRKKTPIIVGGTGLYIDSLVNNIQFFDIKPDEKFRKSAEEEADAYGNGFLYGKLLKIDPESAKKIEVNDRKRIIRALEVYHLTKRTLSEQNALSKSVKSPYSFLMFAIDMDREVLYDRINRRVDVMIQNGLLDEVRHILSLGVKPTDTSMQAIGYKEIVKYINGEVSLDDAKENIKKSSRHYAKRQLTWFRRNDKINWINADVNEILKKAEI